MAKLSSVGYMNGDDVEPSYDTDIMSEVPNYYNYHKSDMFNHFVQEFPYSNQLVFVNDTYVDFLSDSNVSSNNPYADTNEDEVVQEITSLTQNGVAILSLIENMQHKLTGYEGYNVQELEIDSQSDRDEYDREDEMHDSDDNSEPANVLIDEDNIIDESDVDVICLK
ncbi:hypothetical protein Tco_0712855 [Tanacetum coccineum]